MSSLTPEWATEHLAENVAEAYARGARDAFEVPTGLIPQQLISVCGYYASEAQKHGRRVSRAYWLGAKRALR